MILGSELEVANTQAKLVELEARYDALRRDPSPDDRVRQVTMRSLKRLINQFTEEIARYRAHQPVQK